MKRGEGSLGGNIDNIHIILELNPYRDGGDPKAGLTRTLSEVEGRCLPHEQLASTPLSGQNNNKI
jgi:hypothetical protein